MPEEARLQEGEEQRDRARRVPADEVELVVLDEEGLDKGADYRKIKELSSSLRGW